MSWQFGTNDALTRKIWSKLSVAAEREYLEIAPLIGSDQNACIIRSEEVSGEAGDEATIRLRKRLAQRGFSENDPGEGNGEPMSFFPFKFRVNELLAVVILPGKDSISQKRVVMDLRGEAKDGVAEWHGERASAAFFNQVCGYTPQTDQLYTGLNAVSAPSSGRILRPAGLTDDNSITSSHPFTLELIDSAVSRMVTGSKAMRRINIGGKKKFVAYLHPGQVESARTAAGGSRWEKIQLAALQGGKDHVLYQNALGEYNDVILRSSQDVTLGVTNAGVSKANVRRAVILGAGAACYAEKKLSTGTTMKWYEKERNQGRELEMSAMKICGIKKASFESEDYGTFVLPTYSPL